MEPELYTKTHLALALVVGVCGGYYLSVHTLNVYYKLTMERAVNQIHREYNIIIQGLKNKIKMLQGALKKYERRTIE